MSFDVKNFLHNFEIAANTLDTFLDKNGFCVKKDKKATFEELNKIIQKFIKEIDNYPIPYTKKILYLERIKKSYKLIIDSEIKNDLKKIENIKKVFFKFLYEDPDKITVSIKKKQILKHDQIEQLDIVIRSMAAKEIFYSDDPIIYLKHLQTSLEKATTDSNSFITIRGTTTRNSDEAATLIEIQGLIKNAIDFISQSGNIEESLKFFGVFFSWLESTLQTNPNLSLKEIAIVIENTVYFIQSKSISNRNKKKLLRELFGIYNHFLELKENFFIQTNNSSKELTFIRDQKQIYNELAKKGQTSTKPALPSVKATALIRLIENREYNRQFYQSSGLGISVDYKEPHIKRITTSRSTSDSLYDPLNPQKVYAYYKTTSTSGKIRKEPEIEREEVYLKVVNILIQKDSEYIVPASRINSRKGKITNEITHKQLAIDNPRNWYEVLYYLYHNRKEFDFQKIQEAALLMGDTGQYDLHKENGFAVEDSDSSEIYFVFNDNGRSLSPTNYFFTNVKDPPDEHHLPFHFAAMLSPACQMPLTDSIKAKALENVSEQRLKEIEDHLRGKSKIGMLKLIRRNLNQMEKKYSNVKNVIIKFKELIHTKTFGAELSDEKALENEFWEILKGEKKLQSMSDEFRKFIGSNEVDTLFVLEELRNSVDQICPLLEESQINALMERLRQKQRALQNNENISCVDIWRAQYPAFQLFLELAKEGGETPYQVASQYISFESLLRKAKYNHSSRLEELSKEFNRLKKEAETAKGVINYLQAVNWK